MQKLVLAYNFTEERFKALKLVSFVAKAACKTVPREDMLNPIGFVAGLEGFAAVEEKFTGDDALDEMIIMCAFTRPDLDRFLSAIKKNKTLQSIPLKCVLTPTNAEWSAVRLMTELKAEHEYMQTHKQSKVHKTKA